MNSKVIAMIVAVSMIVVALSGALLTGQSDAVADQDEIYQNGTIQVVSGDNATRELRVNEQEFAGYAYTLTWKAAELSSSEDTPVDNTWNTTLFTNKNTIENGAPSIVPDIGDSLELGGFTVDINRGTDDPVGAYTLTVSASSATSPQYIGLQCEITVNVGGTSRTLADVYYVYTLTQVAEATNTINLAGMTMEENAVFGLYVSESTESGNPLLGSIGNYYWYATGLPAGISMSETGYVSGVPLVATKQGAPVVANVVATDRTTGETYEGTLSITVSPYNETIEGYRLVLAVESGSGTDVTNGSSFAAVQGESVVLTVYSTSDDPDILIDASNVTVVDSTGHVSSILSDPTGTYTIPSNGTGAYRVVVTVGESGSSETIGFYLFVTPSLDNISAGIHVSGN